MIYVIWAACLLVLFVTLYRPARKFYWWVPPKKGLVAFMYHHIGECSPKDEQYPFTIPPQQFENHLQMLKELGKTPISLADLPNAAKSQKPVLLTFDDGYEDHYTQLFPLLKKYNVPALIFLITSKMDSPGYLTWEQAREMLNSGLVSFGSHSHTHRRLRSLSADEIKEELSYSRDTIRRELGFTPQAFCYPFGAGPWDKRVHPLVLEAGYRYEFSTKKGINSLPLKPQKPLLRAFPRGGETLLDFRLQATRGKSRF